jgi:hypothetical protein
MIDTGGTLSRRFNEKGALSVEQFVHTPFYQEIYEENRKVSIIRINSYRFDSIKERI